jgi:nucleoside-diphosphate-sugar epimerase
LAALSNDPVGELNPEKTFEINHAGRARVARLSKEQGVPRYILASSASIYGQQTAPVDENSPVNPITAYSKANRMAEIDTLPLSDNDFTVTVLRFSSIYGISPRMRFDLAVNSLALDLYKTGKIFVQGKNNSRPFLHIKDAIAAYRLIIESKKEKIAGQIFNVGANDQNYVIYDLAKEVGDSIGEKFELEAKDTRDNRSYVAIFDKISKLGFKTTHTVGEGAKEIYAALKNKTLDPDLRTFTLKWYNHILSDPELAKKFSIDGKIL